MLKIVARQARHPSGLLGHLVARVMTKTTAPENKLALDLLAPVPGESILELGCGHGRILKQVAARCKPGRVVGVDPSDVMLSIARSHLQYEISHLGLRLLVGDADNIPAADHSFDKVFSVHTVYFWPDLLRGCRNLRRILLPGGELLLVCRSADEPDLTEGYPQEVYSFRSHDELRTALTTANFRDVKVSVGRDNISFVSAIAT